MTRKKKVETSKANADALKAAVKKDESAKPPIGEAAYKEWLAKQKNPA